MKISQLANETGLSASTIRYYEKEGLIQSKRDENNYRAYQPEYVDILNFISRCKLSGFTLKESSVLVTIKGNKSEHICEEAKMLTQSKIVQITDKIETLQSMLLALTQLESLCCGGKHSAEFCRIIKTLETKPIEEIV